MSHAPSSEQPEVKPLYERDLYAWSREQACLLRRDGWTRSTDECRREILDVGSNEYDKLENALRVLLIHVLKWDAHPEIRSRWWESTIAIQRRHALRQLRRSPA